VVQENREKIVEAHLIEPEVKDDFYGKQVRRDERA
jgi:hypothetical protein